MAAIAERKKNMNLLKHARRSTRWVIIVLESILFHSLYLPHTWGGEVTFEEYYKTLKEVDRNMQDVKQKFHTSRVLAGMDAHVEVKPHQEPFVGGGTRMFWSSLCTDTSSKRGISSSGARLRKATNSDPMATESGDPAATALPKPPHTPP